MDFHCLLLCREKDIGVWLTVMKAMVYIGILTNCFILGFSSEQLMQWLPWLFTRNTVDGDQVMALGSGRYAGNYSDACNIFFATKWLVHTKRLHHFRNNLLRCQCPHLNSEGSF